MSALWLIRFCISFLKLLIIDIVRSVKYAKCVGYRAIGILTGMPKNSGKLILVSGTMIVRFSICGFNRFLKSPDLYSIARLIVNKIHSMRMFKVLCWHIPMP
jgi:hypothetical protein